MLDLKKLEDMLDSALKSETAESLNHWIDHQMAEDRAQGIIRDAEFGILNLYDKSSRLSSLDNTIIQIS